MTKIETSIEINAPIDQVWAIMLDYGAYGDWNPYIKKIEGDAIAGTQIIVHSAPTPTRSVIAAPVEVISVAPHTMRWEGGFEDREKFKGDHWFVLEGVDQVTRIQHFEHFSGSLAPILLDKHRAVIEENFNIFNRALKAYAERSRP